MAERLATQLGKHILVIDRRPHIGGNAYDYRNEAGVLTHLYGPHIFHTNSDAIFDYLGNFTDWHPYEHRVRARIGDLEAPMPINRTTLNLVYGANLATEELSHPAPVFHGDTLFAETEVLEVRPSRSKPDRGTVKVHTRVLNQDGTLVAEFKRLVLVPKREV